MSDAVRAIK